MNPATTSAHAAERMSKCYAAVVVHGLDAALADSLTTSATTAGSRGDVVDLTPSERPKTRPPAGGRLAIYVLGTIAVCAIAAVIGETIFPAELIGDTGENDFAGLAAMVWALGAFILCVAASIAYEVYAHSHGRQSNTG